MLTPRGFGVLLCLVGTSAIAPLAPATPAKLRLHLPTCRAPHLRAPHPVARGPDDFRDGASFSQGVAGISFIGFAFTTWYLTSFIPEKDLKPLYKSVYTASDKAFDNTVEVLFGTNTLKGFDKVVAQVTQHPAQAWATLLAGLLGAALINQAARSESSLGRGLRNFGRPVDLLSGISFQLTYELVRRFIGSIVGGYTGIVTGAYLGPKNAIDNATPILYEGADRFKYEARRLGEEIDRTNRGYPPNRNYYPFGFINPNGLSGFGRENGWPGFGGSFRGFGPQIGGYGGGGYGRGYGNGYGNGYGRENRGYRNGYGGDNRNYAARDYDRQRNREFGAGYGQQNRQFGAGYGQQYQNTGYYNDYGAGYGQQSRGYNNDYGQQSRGYVQQTYGQQNRGYGNDYNRQNRGYGNDYNRQNRGTVRGMVTPTRGYNSGYNNGYGQQERGYGNDYDRQNRGYGQQNRGYGNEYGDGLDDERYGEGYGNRDVYGRSNRNLRQSRDSYGMNSYGAQNRGAQNRDVYGRQNSYGDQGRDVYGRPKTFYGRVRDGDLTADYDSYGGQSFNGQSFNGQNRDVYGRTNRNVYGRQNRDVNGKEYDIYGRPMSFYGRLKERAGFGEYGSQNRRSGYDRYDERDSEYNGYGSRNNQGFFGFGQQNQWNRQQRQQRYGDYNNRRDGYRQGDNRRDGYRQGGYGGRRDPYDRFEGEEIIPGASDGEYPEPGGVMKRLAAPGEGAIQFPAPMGSANPVKRPGTAPTNSYRQSGRY